MNRNTVYTELVKAGLSFKWIRDYGKGIRTFRVPEEWDDAYLMWNGKNYVKRFYEIRLCPHELVILDICRMQINIQYSEIEEIMVLKIEN